MSETVEKMEHIFPGNEAYDEGKRAKAHEAKKEATIVSCIMWPTAFAALGLLIWMCLMVNKIPWLIAVFSILLFVCILVLLYYTVNLYRSSVDEGYWDRTKRENEQYSAFIEQDFSTKKAYKLTVEWKDRQAQVKASKETAKWLKCLVCFFMPPLWILLWLIIKN